MAPCQCFTPTRLTVDALLVTGKMYAPTAACQRSRRDLEGFAGQQSETRTRGGLRLGVLIYTDQKPSVLARTDGNVSGIHPADLGDPLPDEAEGR